MFSDLAAQYQVFLINPWIMWIITLTVGEFFFISFFSTDMIWTLLVYRHPTHEAAGNLCVLMNHLFCHLDMTAHFYFSSRALWGKKNKIKKNKTSCSWLFLEVTVWNSWNSWSLLKWLKFIRPEGRPAGPVLPAAAACTASPGSTDKTKEETEERILAEENKSSEAVWGRPLCCSI